MPTKSTRAVKAQSQSPASRRRPVQPQPAAPTLDGVEALAARSGVGSSTILRVLGYRREGFPGFVAIDPRGAALAKKMLEELERVNSDGSARADDSALENETREGRPFRNVVAEYVDKAHAIDPTALEAFYAVLSDYVSTCCQGSTPDASNYNRYCRRSPPSGKQGSRGRQQEARS